MVESLDPQTPSSPRVAANSAEHDRRFEGVLKDHQGALRTFLRLCGAGQDTDDVLQETNERVWLYRHSCDLEQAPKAWLQQAAFRCWLDHKKRHRKTPAPFGDQDHAVLARADNATELREQLDRALAHMTDVEREILLRFHQRGDSLQDIAAALRINVNTVKSHLHRARRRLPRGDWQ